MKTIMLIIFLVAVSFSCMAEGQTNDWVLRQTVMEKIRTEARKPYIFNPDSLRSDREIVFNPSEKCPRDFMKDLLIFFDAMNYELRYRRFDEKIRDLEQNAREADDYLKSIPPATLVPLLFKILEEGSFGTNEYEKYYCNWYEDDPEPAVFNLHGRIPIKLDSWELYSAAGSYVSKCLKLDLNDDWYIMSIWTGNGGAVPYKNPGDDFLFYWWYEGRKYATNIWQDFYTCWRLERARETPRPTVLKELADEIACMGITLLPIVKDAIQAGDDTLDPVLKSLAVKLEIGGITNMNYLAWYQQNGSKYELPPCEGLEAAKLRIADTNYVNELEGIFNFNVPGHATARTSDAYHGYMKLYKDQMDYFYTHHPKIPDYWYYKLPDDVQEVDPSIVLDLDRNRTRINPRYPSSGIE